MSSANLRQLVKQYRSDSESVYNTWFIDNETRMKAFRSIRRGVINVIYSIKNGTFGNDFKGSPEEVRFMATLFGNTRDANKNQ
jgi:type II restriction enzyme